MVVQRKECQPRRPSNCGRAQDSERNDPCGPNLPSRRPPWVYWMERSRWQARGRIKTGKIPLALNASLQILRRRNSPNRAMRTVTFPKRAKASSCLGLLITFIHEVWRNETADTDFRFRTDRDYIDCGGRNDQVRGLDCTGYGCRFSLAVPPKSCYPTEKTNVTSRWFAEQSSRRVFEWFFQAGHFKLLPPKRPGFTFREQLRPSSCNVPDETGLATTLPGPNSRFRTKIVRPILVEGKKKSRNRMCLQSTMQSGSCFMSGQAETYAASGVANPPFVLFRRRFGRLL